MKEEGKWITKLAILTLLFILAINTISVQAQEDGLVEHFDDPALPGWEKTPGVAGMDGILRMEPGNFAAHHGEWGEMEISTRMRLQGQGELFFMYHLGEGFAYRLVIGNDYIVLFRDQAGGETELAATSPIPIAPEEWFHLELLSTAGMQVILINGELILEVFDDNPLPAGGIALETAGETSLEVDDITIMQTDSPPPLEEELKPEAVPQEEVSPTAEIGQPTAGALPQEPWVYTGGPNGGLGYDIRVDPRDNNVMYVTDALAGVFKSENGGKSWFPINSGITSRTGYSGDAIPIFSLTIDPNNPDTLWVGTQFGSEVYRSDDAGKSWQAMNNGIKEQSLTIRGFGVEPGNSNVVYFAAEISSWEGGKAPRNGISFDLTSGVVYKSTNGGKNWQPVWYGDHLARYVLIDPNDSNLLYVSTGIFDREAANSNPETLEPGGVGVVRSKDGGATWEILGVEHGFRSDELYVGSLAMNPQDSKTLFSANGSDAHLWALNRLIGAIYRSTDGGDHWQRVLDLPNASSVEICESNPDVIYAGATSFFYRSDDGGDTWTQTDGSTTGGLGEFWGPDALVAGFPIDMQCDPQNPMRIFVNNYGGGNFLSEDGGFTWVNLSKGYTGAIMANVTASPTNPAVVYASARSGVFVSQNGGGDWMGMARGAARAMEGQGITVNPQDQQHVIAVVSDSGPSPKISYDGGLTWKEVANFDWEVMRIIRFSPSIPNRVVGILGERNLPGGENHETGFGVLYSNDGGENWAQSNLNQGIAVNLAFSPHGSDAYVILSPDTLYHSTDGGQSWELTARNILSSVGIQLQDSDLSGPVMTAVAVDSQNPARLYAGVSPGGILISEDGGESWSRFSAGMPPELIVQAIIADAAHPGVIYAATVNNGVFRSQDSGETWVEINQGLLNRASQAMWLSADGSTLYLATDGAGVFRLTPDGQPPISNTAPQAGNVSEEEAIETGAEPPAPSTSLNENDGVEETVLPKLPFPLFLIIGAGIFLLFLAAVLIVIAVSKRAR